ncbi:TonB-dependent receptor domain-containing protein [candidate division CSSED10-310 bacterium]|uniref:TonB-dependent receptor domain-containing protein n=1 Tax=candidate division CSSED10-310 bacterium TaxID=2855610 RepID=A0ABV6Z5X5_UNCC1
MKKYSVFLAIIMALVLGQVSEAALTGNITGKVIDSTGQPMPGVLVIVTGTGLPGARSDTTRQDGVYRIVLLPPGKYTLRAELTGFKTVEHQEIEVNINETTKLNFALEVATFEEVVVVTAEAPVLDTKSTTVGIHVDREFTERLPNSDQFQDAFAMGGATTGGDNPRVAGGTDYDNLYLYDGVDTTDPVTNTFSSNLNADAIEEVEVQTGGYSAEYGKAMGGIVNAVTKSGGNEFEGIIRFKYENDALNSKRKDEETRGEYTVKDNFEPTFSLGGPILKDKIWFFISYRRTQDHTSLDVRESRDPETNDYTLTSIDRDQLWQYWVTKFNWAVNASHNIEVSYSSDPAVVPNYDPAGTLNRSPQAQGHWEQGGDRVGMIWTYIHSSNLYFDSKFGYFNSYIYQSPENDSGLPAIWDRRANIWYQNFDQIDDNDREKWSLSTIATFIKDSWKGTHEFKTGLEYQSVTERRYFNYTTGEYYATDWYQTEREAPYRRYNILDPQAEKNRGHVVSFFIQDSWEIVPGVTINPGLRYDRSTYINKEGTTVHTFDGMIAPRLGLSWDLQNNGKSKAYFSFGRYYNTYDLTITGAEPGPTAISQTWSYDPTNPDADADGYYLLNTSGGDVSLDILDSDLKPEYADEFVIGYDQEIMARFSAGARFIYKITRDIIEDEGFWEDEQGNIHRASQVDMNDEAAILEWYEKFSDEYRYYYTNPSDAYRDYIAVEFHSTARTDNLSLEFSYTFAKTTGTTDNMRPSGNGMQHFSEYFDTPFLCHNIDGRLFYDVPHYIKLFASYRLPWGFSVGTHSWFKSGYTYNHYVDDPYSDTYTDTFPEGGRGSHRYPDVFMVDLSLQKDFNFGRWGMLTAMIDVSNALDNQLVLAKVEEDANFGQEIGWGTPRSVLFQLKYEF